MSVGRIDDDEVRLGATLGPSSVSGGRRGRCGLADLGDDGVGVVGQMMRDWSRGRTYSSWPRRRTSSCDCGAWVGARAGGRSPAREVVLDFGRCRGSVQMCFWSSPVGTSVAL
jgi:hypothetical protein